MPTTFEVLSPDGSPIFLASLPNERGGGKPHHQYVRDDAELQKFLTERDGPGWAIYHTAAILKEGTWRNKENVRGTLYVWGETDFKDHKDISEQEIVRRLDSIPLRPTFSVFSGHGIHLYWGLKEEEDASPGEGQRRIEDVLVYCGKATRGFAWRSGARRGKARQQLDRSPFDGIPPSEAVPF